jgi:DNA-binding LacI/PurR family transcriptional regulator
MRDGVFQICVLMGNIFTKHPMEVLRGLTVSAMEQGINLTVFPGAQGSIYDYWNATSEEAGDNLSFSEYNYQYNALYDYALIGGFDAIIITYGTLMMFLDNDTKGDFFSKFDDIPLVILQDYSENNEYCYLLCENYQGMFNVVEHLIEAHGRRKILYLSGPKMNTEASERLRGYFDAVRSHGLDISLDMIAYGDYSQDVEPQVEELLNKNPDADAIACANDEMAMAVYRVCRRRGIVIGRDISITGFDDVEQAATLNPPLTTARQDGYQLGRMALELAIKRIKGEANNGLHTFSTPLVVRGSCGCDFNILDSSEGVLSLIDGFGEHFREDGYISRAASAIAADSMMYMYSPDVRKACE